MKGNIILYILVFVVGFLVAVVFVGNYAFKVGQIAAFNGEAHYQLQKTDNSEIKWIEQDEAINIKVTWPDK